MGCDSFLYDVGDPVRLDLRCYACGERIDKEYPRLGHEGCIELDSSDRERLRVDLDFSESLVRR